MSDISFTAFVISLASSAAMHFGDLPDPERRRAPEPNLEGAKQMIDILALLEEKTKGNLTTEERQVLEQVLYELRLRFVEVSGGGSASSNRSSPQPPLHHQDRNQHARQALAGDDAGGDRDGEFLASFGRISPNQQRQQGPEEERYAVEPGIVNASPTPVADGMNAARLGTAVRGSAGGCRRARPPPVRCAPWDAERRRRCDSSSATPRHTSAAGAGHFSVPSD